MFWYNDIKFKEIIITNKFAKYSNVTYLVKKTVRQYLSEPYGQCNRYESREQTSRTQCYRQCVQNQYNNRFNCVPVFIDYYNHDLDYNYLRNRFCEELLQNRELPMMTSISVKCRSQCHKECNEIRYSSEVKEYDSYVENINLQTIGRFMRNNVSYPFHVQFHTGEPMFRYTEEPVLTFTSYLVNCGGLMGLWFGASAHGMIVLILESNVWKLILGFATKLVIQTHKNYICPTYRFAKTLLYLFIAFVQARFRLSYFIWTQHNWSF